MSRRSRTGRGLAALFLAALVTAGCAGDEAAQRQAQSAREGLQITGQFSGRRVAVSSGAPDVVFGDCDPNLGLDRDLCVTGRTIDGGQLTIVIENPAVLTAGRRIPVRSHPCDTDCDGINSQAVVDVRLAGESHRAIAGSLTPTTSDGRLAVDLSLTLPSGGRLSGEIDVSDPRR